MRIDTASLNASADLLSLISRHTELRRRAATGGGEFAGPCPRCGGRDRFRAWPHAQPPRWWCRGCGEGGDAIAFVRLVDGVDFREACRRLGAGDDAPRSGWARPPVPAPRTPEPEVAEPSAAWCAAALAFVERCEAALWSPVGARARAYLHDRGVRDGTLRAWRVGCNPAADRWEDAARWGLSDNRAQVFVPRGITLPWFVDGALWQVKVRRSPGQEPKYRSVAGGHPLLYGAATLPGKRVALVCEGEFDAILAWQAAGDFVGVVTLGSCSQPLGARALRTLLPVGRLLVCYDADAEGQKGAAKLAAVSARARQVTVPWGGDVTEFHRQGGDVRAWLQAELARHGRGVVPAEPWDERAAERLLRGAWLGLALAYPDVPPGCPVAGGWWDDADHAINQAFAAQDMGGVRSALDDLQRHARRVFGEWTGAA